MNNEIGEMNPEVLQAIDVMRKYCTTISKRYGFEGGNIAAKLFPRNIKASDMMLMLWFIGKESTGMTKKFRSTVDISKSGLRKLLRSIKHRTKLCKNTNKYQDFAGKELIAVDGDLFRMTGGQPVKETIAIWNSLLSCLHFINGDNVHFKILCRIAMNSEGVTKYHWCSVNCDTRGRINPDALQSLVDQGYNE